MSRLLPSTQQRRARGAQAWEHGGYSDDLIVAAQCSRHGLHILCPAFALYPQWCAARQQPRWRAPAAPAHRRGVRTDRTLRAVPLRMHVSLMCAAGVTCLYMFDLACTCAWQRATRLSERAGIAVPAGYQHIASAAQAGRRVYPGALLELPTPAAVRDGHVRVRGRGAHQPHHARAALLPVVGVCGARAPGRPARRDAGCGASAGKSARERNQPLSHVGCSMHHWPVA